MDKISSNLKSINVKINDEESNNGFKLKVYLRQFWKKIRIKKYINIFNVGLDIKKWNNIWILTRLKNIDTKKKEKNLI